MKKRLISRMLLLCATIVVLPFLVAAQEEEAQPETWDAEQLKRLSDATLATEISVRRAAEETREERSSFSQTQREVFGGFRNVMRALELNIREMERMPDDIRDRILIEEARDQFRECEATRGEDEMSLRGLREEFERSTHRQEMYRQVFGILGELSRRWKDAGLDTDPLIPLYQSLKKNIDDARSETEYAIVEAEDLRDRWKMWEEQVDPGAGPE